MKSLKNGSPQEDEPTLHASYAGRTGRDIMVTPSRVVVSSQNKIEQQCSKLEKIK